jgi:hypothetical protein
MSKNLNPSIETNGIKIFDRTFSKCILTFTGELNGNALETLVTLRINLKENPEFRDVDMKGPVLIFMNNEPEPRFLGHIESYRVSDGFGVVELKDQLKLKHERVGIFEPINLLPADILALLIESSGIRYKPPSDLIYDDSERDFVIIIPVKNFKTNENFKIGEVEFYCSFNNIDDSFIKKSKNGKESVWTDNLTRAKTVVKANSFLDAIKQGYSVISSAIDMIAFRTDLSFPSIISNSCLCDLEYDYHVQLARVKIPTIVYCRDKEGDFRVIIDIETVRDEMLFFEGRSSEKFFKEVKELCDGLLLKTELSPIEKKYLQVLHWLRKAIQEGNDEDKFLDSWIAFELLISGEKSEKIFSIEDLDNLTNLIRDSPFNDSQKNALMSRIQSTINSNPLMQKFDQLIEKLQITFSTSDREKLTGLYNKRNDLVHGRTDIKIDEDDLNKMRTIIEKVLIGKINATKK